MNKTPIFKWTAMGMRAEGIGEYVTLHDYEAALALLHEFTLCRSGNTWHHIKHKPNLLMLYGKVSKFLGLV